MSRPLVEIRNLPALVSYFREFPEIAKQAARFAVNDAARYGAAFASKVVRSQVAFSRAYIGTATDSNAKIRIKKFAVGNDVEAIIASRDRPTSLARFAVGSPTFGTRRKNARSPRTRVKAGGKIVTLKRGFFLKLRRGVILDDENFNVGLAVRLKKGERLDSSQKASPLGGGAYLLYGPSVAQVFDGVRDEIAGPVADYAAESFFRQFARLGRG